MNTATLKTFAPAVRRQLMEAVSRKLDFVLSAQTPDYLSTFARQVAELRRAALSDRDGLVERVAYTWFNRLAALRYLDARGWHPFRCRVLTTASSDETQPEILKLVRSAALPAELREHTQPSRLNDLIDGRIPSSDPHGEVYRHLVLAACRYYHALLPDLFERLDDQTELLLPDDVLTEHSVVQGFRTEITDDDCAEVEVLGWLYQFYISEKKDEVMARKAAVPSEDIPAVTQLFTPDWIVRYLVENTLGRLWLLNRPDSRLRERMNFYNSGDPEKDFLRISGPEEIQVLDPAVGSGHMLTYAFDLLYSIYEEEGYAATEIPALIIAKNLSGFDICPRAGQLASLALFLKARERSRSVFLGGRIVSPHICVLEDIRFQEGEVREFLLATDLPAVSAPRLIQLLSTLENLAACGSLERPRVDTVTIQSAIAEVESTNTEGQLYVRETRLKILRSLNQALALAKGVHVVVANPPYMGSSAMNIGLRSFLEAKLTAGKADTYAGFILRNLDFVFPGGFVGMITIPNWMSLAGFQDLRDFVLKRARIIALLQCGRGVWGSDFGSCAFVMQNSPASNDRGVFRRLFRRQGEVQSNREIEANFFNENDFPVYRASGATFRRLPGMPIVFWLSERVLDCFNSEVSLGTLCKIREGINTGDNTRFLRLWHEVDTARIGFQADPGTVLVHKWYPYKKGGSFRKWAGNREFVLNWQDNGREIHDFHDLPLSYNGAPMRGKSYFFQESLSWSRITSGRFSVRYYSEGFGYDSTAPSIFAGEAEAHIILGMLNSEVTNYLLAALSPTVDFRITNMANLPYLVGQGERLRAEIRKLVIECVSLASTDWDNAETSWGFRDLPLLRKATRGGSVESTWQQWKHECDHGINRMIELESEINRLFIDAYGLTGELQPGVSEDQITLTRADNRRDMAAFLSYVVGCMMGRYSIERLGLVLANAGDGLEQYVRKIGKSLDQLSFVPDADGIIPVLDGEWFDDDVVARTREFLRATFGESTFRENLRFIEESLGKDLRKYFLTDFYKDHLQTYKKRPIYWMVQSPRKGFSVLIYLHRYTRDTMNIVLNRYLREYQAKMRTRIAHLSHVASNESASARDKTAARKESDKLMKTLRECEEWERETLLPLAQARIELDLDDGVKVNYLKLGEALAPIPGLAAKDDD
jgi:hypothetical protein